MAAPKGNKYVIGNNGGRPPIYNDPEVLIKVCDEYFEYIKGEKKKDQWVREPEPATITGLSLFLGFDSRGTLNEYAKKEEFSHIIKRAMQRVEYRYEQNLSGNTATGSIFALKNMGWQDKTQNEMTGANGAPISLVFNPSPGCQPIPDAD